MIVVFENDILYRNFLFNEKEVKIFKQNFKDTFQNIDINQEKINIIIKRIIKNTKEIDNSDCCYYLNPTNTYSKISIESKAILLHRLVYQLKHPLENISDKFIRHKCDHPWCYIPSHLESGTQADNMLDAFKRGRNPKGDTHGCKKHSDGKIINILEDILSNDSNRCLSYKDVIQKYDISYTMFNYIVNGLKYTHITKNYNLVEIKKRIDKGKGLAHLNSKLNQKDIINIIKLSKNNKVCSIAKMYNVCDLTISKVIKNISYKDLSIE